MSSTCWIQKLTEIKTISHWGMKSLTCSYAVDTLVQTFLYRHAFILTYTHCSQHPSSHRGTHLHTRKTAASCTCVTAHTYTQTHCVFRHLKGKSEIYETINRDRRGVNCGERHWVKKRKRRKTLIPTVIKTKCSPCLSFFTSVSQPRP